MSLELGQLAKFAFNQNICNQFVTLFLILVVLISVSGDSNWLQECDVCYCHWNSGKKTADCKNHTITKIPTKMSTELQVIDLSFNIIPEIRKDEFYDANLQNLHKIYMKNCTLQELNRDSLKGLALLIELDLSNNFIHTLHPGTFSGLVKLRTLLMNNNEIQILENNLFRDLIFLQKIELKNNRLIRIETNTFANLPNLVIINLDSNQLSVLRRETFEKIPKLKDLSLIQNPWNCSCELQPLRDFTMTKNLYTAPTNCHEPPHLRGKLWSEVPTEEFACSPEIVQPGSIRYPLAFNSGTSGTGTKLEAISENITIMCRVRGSPKPEILWFFNKRPINLNDQRIQIRNSVEPLRKYDIYGLYLSELTIYSVKTSDSGTYTCVTENRGGKDEVDFQLIVNTELLENGSQTEDTGSNLLLIICITSVSLMLILVLIIFLICWYWRRRVQNYSKNSTTISENGLIQTKMDHKSQNGSILEGSVIMEMQKSLLTEVNPVEKPPRRTDVETTDTDDSHEIKKTLLDDIPYGSRDDETNSVALSDTTPRSRQTFVDDGYSTNLPPDLLAFPARVPHSPSLQSSVSNIPTDSRLFAKSPLSSPVYQHVLQPVNGNVSTPIGIYGTMPVGFRTLQHPKARNLALQTAVNAVTSNNRNNSPFIPAPIIYPPVVMKQGYMTIPRKPRVPSWAPSSTSTQLSEFQTTNLGTSETEADGSLNEFSEPVYDNLGARTTAGGKFVKTSNRLGNNNNQAIVKYTMKDRPLPATPSSIASTSSTSLLIPSSMSTSLNGTIPNNAQTINNNSSNLMKIYEPIHELINHNDTRTSDTEPLYGTAKSKQNLTIVPSTNSNGNGVTTTTTAATKIPPRPPPKPKKKFTVTSNGQGSTSQLFEDEGEDGTEV